MPTMKSQPAISLKEKAVILVSLALILFAGFPLRANAATTTYTYDSLNRLTKADFGITIYGMLVIPPAWVPRARGLG